MNQSTNLDRARATLATLDRIMPEVDAFYCDLHRHPELSLQEQRTAAKAATWMRQAGLDVTTGIGGHGVVGLLRNGDGPTVMIRGDMDALPIHEQTGAPYASETPGAMHACGHDAHTSCMVTAARLLAEHRDLWRGTLMAVAQPAEEIFQGAAPMLREGLYTRFVKPDVVLGQHTWPFPTGTIAHRAGTIMSAAATLEVTIHGIGGHGAAPETTVDPVVIAASTVVRLQSIIAREVKPGEPAVLTVGKLHAGTQANIIPDRATLGINIRSQNDEVQRRLIDAIHRIVTAECEAGRSPRPPEIAFVNGAPCTVNDAQTVDRVRAAHAAWFGPENVIEMERLMATEDFSLYATDGVPIAYWFLGVLNREQWEAAPGNNTFEKVRNVPGVHNPCYLPDRPAALRAGIEAMVVASLAFLG